MKTGMTRKVWMLGMAALCVVAFGCARYRANHESNNYPTSSNSPATSNYPVTSPSTGGQMNGAGTGYGTGTAKVLTPDEIKSYQQALQDSGFNPGPINGSMTPETSAAIRSFQQANNIPATGNFDLRTEQALQAKSGTTIQSPSNH